MSEFLDQKEMAARSRRSLRLRLAGLVFMAVLMPLPWAEHTSCNGGAPQIKTGIDFFFKGGQGYALIPMFILIALGSAPFDERFHVVARILVGAANLMSNAFIALFMWLALFLDIGGKTKVLLCGGLSMFTIVFLLGESFHRFVLEIALAIQAWRDKKNRPPPDDSTTAINS